MDPSQQQQNPLQALMGLMGPSAAAPATPQQAMPPPQAAVPQGGGASPTQAAPPASPQQSGMNPMIQGLMGQAQSTMNAPMGQPVPGPSTGLEGMAQHPIVQALIKGIAQMAQNYGWTAMMPQERLERTQMQQQKAEALSRLAETGAYQEGMLGIRGQQLGINQANADTRKEVADTGQARQATYADFLKFREQNMQDTLELKQQTDQWKRDIAEGRLDKVQQQIDQRATQFEQKFQLAQKQFGLNAAKVELQGEGVGIKQGMLDLAKTALAQKGTVEGAQAMSKIQQFKIEHPIMSQFMDMSDLDQLTGAAGGAGIPGAAPIAPPPQATPSGVPSPSVAAPTGKANAKKQQSGSGGTHIYFDAQGNQVAR
jgi:hypothetical protein